MQNFRFYFLLQEADTRFGRSRFLYDFPAASSTAYILIRQLRQNNKWSQAQIRDDETWCGELAAADAFSTNGHQRISVLPTPHFRPVDAQSRQVWKRSSGKNKLTKTNRKRRIGQTGQKLHQQDRFLEDFLATVWHLYFPSEVQKSK